VHLIFIIAISSVLAVLSFSRR